MRDLADLGEAERRFLMRTDWGFVHQNPIDGLRMRVSAGANVGERLMAVGERHYGRIRGTATDWLARVEIAADRIDDLPIAFSGGMRQRLQIARNLVTHPRLVFMDEPTGGLDVSVQARVLDLLRGLVADLGLAVVIVTHDLAVARLLSQRMIVMKDGRVVEDGLTDRVLDDPRHPYTQLLVASIPESLTMGHGSAPAPKTTMLDVDGVAKSFRMHLRGGVELPVVRDVCFAVAAGECVVLGGPSGVGKSSILRMVYGNYGVDAGAILLRDRETGDHAGPRRRRSAPRARPAPDHHRLCQPVPPRRAPRPGARRRGRAAARPRCGAGRGAAPRRRHAVSPQSARRAARPAARHLLGWREAARQHRPRLPDRSSGLAAR